MGCTKFASENFNTMARARRNNKYKKEYDTEYNAGSGTDPYKNGAGEE